MTDTRAWLGGCECEKGQCNAANARRCDDWSARNATHAPRIEMPDAPFCLPGRYLAQQDGRWHLFEPTGKPVRMLNLHESRFVDAAYAQGKADRSKE